MVKRSSWEALRARLAREQTILVSLTLAYVVLGKLGLALAYSDRAASLVSPPAGIALGAFLILGYRIWPAMLAAGVILYSATIGPVPAALAMAGANTLESLLAAYLVNRYASGRHALQNPGNSLRFAGVLLLSSMTLSATAAATSLALGDVAQWTSYGSIWFTVVLG